MRKLIIQIEMENAAFEDDAGAEVARILREIADKAEAGVIVATVGTARDINGNIVGGCSYIQRGLER